ncbi:protein kinase domain containing protein [Stylonychia lemnae]|uniref:non-specific serine/threonine protein kinase n=1 Tax=Stylonychia lemnae TaxID=5949 RepID=A0A078AVJ8_STYLE|nr:protein kinase domain containing protein [Stylonychia lemnae]|eukprot:CDW85297.1 protein kinase domain containing protein [Stylonychia lemnae]
MASNNPISHQSSITNFHVMQKLGEGAYSQVFKVKRISDGAEYAMKKVKMIKLSERERQNAVNEVRILASIQHPNIIAYKEAFFEDSTSCLCIIMEYADGGDLLKQINNHKRKGTNFSEKESWYYFIQMVRGLKALHDLKICHRDIKCANLFLTKEGIVKLGDLNVSKVAKKGMLHTQTGTPYYASPEVWKDKPYDHRSDIWSLGCVLYEMLTLNPPFRAPNMNGLYHKVLRGLYDPVPSMYTKDLQFMVRNCLQVSPVARPSCEKILAMPGLLNHLTGTLERIDVSIDVENDALLNTIKVPKDLGQITERLPKPQYNVMRRINSLPPEQQEGLQEDKENLIQIAHKMFDNHKRIAGGLANNIYEERKRSVLATIEENVPPSREYDRPREFNYDNPRSAEPNLQKSKARNLHNIEKDAIIHETRTPHYMNNQKQKARDLISHQSQQSNQGVYLPRIQSTRASEITGINQRRGVYSRNSPDIQSTNSSILPGIRGAQSRNSENTNPIYMNKGTDIVHQQKNYLHQKKILQQIYGAYQIPSHRRLQVLSEELPESRIHPRYII